MKDLAEPEQHRCEDHCVEHYNESELKCPYCLYEETDSYEILMGDGNESGTADCPECSKKYKYGTEITYADGGVSTIYFNTEQIGPEDE